MRKHFMLVAAAIAVLTAALGAQAKPNFSGVWVMDASKSDFGQMPAPGAMTRTITHKDVTVKINTVQSGGATGDRTIDTTFTTDGKPQTNTVLGSQMTTTGKWDGSALVFSSTMATAEATVPIEDRYSLSPDGKTLTVTRKVTTPDGVVNMKTVLTKQEK